MIIEKLTKEDANEVPCDECGLEFADDDGINIEFANGSEEVGLCSNCKKELLNRLLKFV